MLLLEVGSNKVLTKNTLDKIVYEYQHGGVKGNHPELNTYERKALLKHLFSLPTLLLMLCERINKNGKRYF
jgi:hypothetical protein